MYSRAVINAPDGTKTEVLTFGPISVLPDYQNKGIGSALMRHSIVQAGYLGFSAIVFHGHADYYPRFGFKRAYEFGLAHGSDSCMAMELIPGALNIPGGKFKEDAVFFDLPEHKVKAFEKTFPPKEPRPRVPIEALLQKLDPPACEALRSLELVYLGKLRGYSERSIAALPGVGAKEIEIIKTTMKENGRVWGKRDE